MAKYRPYAVPANWKSAEEHSRAVRIGMREETKYSFCKESALDAGFINQSKNPRNQDNLCLDNHSRGPSGLRSSIFQSNQIQEGHGKGGAQEKFCPCCLRPIEFEEFSLCSPVSDLAELGSGYPMYYSTLKFSIISLCVLAINSTMIILYDELIHAKIGPSENGTASRGFWELGTSTQHLNDQNNSISKFTYFSIVSFISQFVLLVLFRRKQLAEEQFMYKPGVPDQSEYSLLITGLPTGNDDNQSKITQFLHSVFQQPFQETRQSAVSSSEWQFGSVESVVPLLSLQELDAAHTRVKHYLKVWRKAADSIQTQMPSGEQNPSKSQDLTPLLRDLLVAEQLCEKKNQYIRFNERLYFLGSAIITCSTKEFRDYILENQKRMNDRESVALLQDIFDQTDFWPESESSNSKRIQAHVIGMPKQIKWENLVLSKQEREAHSSYSLVLLFLTLGAFFMLYLVMVNLLHQHYYWVESSSGISWAQSLSFSKLERNLTPSILCMILVCSMNKFVLAGILHKITEMNLHQTYSGEECAFAVWSAVCQFVTTAILSIIVEGEIHQNFTRSLGVIEQESLMFLINGVYLVGIWLVNPWFWWKKMWAQLGRKKKTLCQQEANQLLELPEYQLGKRYGDLIKTYWFVFMYANIIPASSIVTFIALALYYWVDKWNLLRRSSVKFAVSARLAQTMDKLLDFSLILKPLSNLYFRWKMEAIFDLPELIMALIALLYLSFPVHKLMRWFWVVGRASSKIAKQSLPYKIALPKLQAFYAFQYPLGISKQDKLTFLRKKSNLDQAIAYYTKKEAADILSSASNCNQRRRSQPGSYVRKQRFSECLGDYQSKKLGIFASNKQIKAKAKGNFFNYLSLEEGELRETRSEMFATKNEKFVANHPIILDPNSKKKDEIPSLKEDNWKFDLE